MLFSLTHTVVLMLSFIYAVYYFNYQFFKKIYDENDKFYTNFGHQQNLYRAISQSNIPIAFDV